MLVASQVSETDDRDRPFRLHPPTGRGANMQRFALARCCDLPNFSRPFCPIIGPEQRTPDFHRNPRNDPLGLGFPMLPHQKPPEMTIFLRQRPWRPMLSRASMILCIAAVAALGGGRAAAQNCFLFFCPPGAQPPWQTTPAPDRQTEPSRPLFNGDFQYSTIYAQRESEPFPVPALRMSQIDPTYLRK